ncbi:hypothetical protein [Vreelandella venusta]|uniref:hypothetical protein n=1 Tax=Vreelandella venusta TaxID=44935 RepID=UPI0011704AD6|nr:hypothetical protein [Halomonas venusta]GEK52399.1 hypothetical protein HVE01_31200 [Halomonas venusta]
MRALLISRGEPLITEVELPPGQVLRVTRMQELLECRLFTGAGYPNQIHACWVDDEAVLTLEADVIEHGYVLATQTSWFPETLIGSLLITGYDPVTGTTTPATLSVQELASMIKPGQLVLDTNGE